MSRLKHCMLLSMSSATDTLGVPLLKEEVKVIWEEQKHHVPCLQDPPGVELYTINCRSCGVLEGPLPWRVSTCILPGSFLERLRVPSRRTCWMGLPGGMQHMPQQPSSLRKKSFGPSPPGQSECPEPGHPPAPGGASSVQTTRCLHWGAVRSVVPLPTVRVPLC